MCYDWIMANATVTLSIDEDVLAKARESAEAQGTSVNQMIRDFLADFVTPLNRKVLREELVRLHRQQTEPLSPWKFNREELYERR
jgi:antitoxin component of RelBE/YafQ-DinJ toxin-antitoxin module